MSNILLQPTKHSKIELNTNDSTLLYIITIISIAAVLIIFLLTYEESISHLILQYAAPVRHLPQN